MSGKLPRSFSTDQCAAIRCAINTVMPAEMFHGLCSWHITENAKKNLGCYADSEFLSELDFLINENDTPDEFDFNWNKIVAKCFRGRNED
ncbi:hypothetical protein LIER_43479 [Lithospermum erythrorhizon]|uniref:Protein FAR1-RELATED SEQUENCE n=1 Tax=Lithospermum erythrorhizon TaxID=34254 RepID=A0AAV3Q5M5_LITER